MKKNIFFRVIAILLVMSAMVMFLEFMVRLWGPRYYRFNNLSQEYYTNPRGYHLLLRQEGKDAVYGLNYQFNARGYRMPDAGFKNEEKAYKFEHFILGLGDSFTYGRGVKYNDLYLTILQKLLLKSGFQVGIDNCAQVGANIGQIVETYVAEASKRKYVAVVYGFVLNDFGLENERKIIGNDFIDFNNGGYAYDRFRSVSRLYNYICYLVEKMRLHQFTIQEYKRSFQGENAQLKFGLLEALNKRIITDSGELVVMILPLLYDFKRYPFRDIHEAIAGFCLSRNILFLDLLPVFSKYRAEDLWVNPTDHHPNEIAHRIIAGALFDFLSKNHLTD